MITVAETEPFQRKVGRLLSENEKTELIAYLSMNPNAGVLIQESKRRSTYPGDRRN